MPHHRVSTLTLTRILFGQRILLQCTVWASDSTARACFCNIEIVYASNVAFVQCSKMLSVLLEQCLHEHQLAALHCFMLAHND